MKNQSTIEASATPVLESVLSPDEAAIRSQAILNNYRNFKALSEQHTILLNRKIMFDAFFDDAEVSPSTVIISNGNRSFTLNDSRASHDVIDILGMRNDSFIAKLEAEICNFVF